MGPGSSRSAVPRTRRSSRLGPFPPALHAGALGASQVQSVPPTLLLRLLNTQSKRFSKRFVFDDIIEAVRCPFLFPDTLTCRHRV